VTVSAGSGGQGGGADPGTHAQGAQASSATCKGTCTTDPNLPKLPDIVVVKHNVVGIPMSCPKQCAGKLTLQGGAAKPRAARMARKQALGTKAFALRPHGRHIVKVRLNRAGRRLVRSAKRVTVTMVLRLKEGKRKVTASRALMVVRKLPKKHAAKKPAYAAPLAPMSP
jgi:hypothetical protein